MLWCLWKCVHEKLKKKRKENEETKTTKSSYQFWIFVAAIFLFYICSLSSAKLPIWYVTDL